MPRVGNQAFADFVDSQLSGSVTHVNNQEDSVPVVPGEFLGLHYPSREIHILDSGAWDDCPRFFVLLGLCLTLRKQCKLLRSRQSFRFVIGASLVMCTRTAAADKLGRSSRLCSCRRHANLMIIDDGVLPLPRTRARERVPRAPRVRVEAERDDDVEARPQLAPARKILPRITYVVVDPGHRCRLRCRTLGVS